MTKLLEKAFAEAAKLPEREQEALGALMLEEIESERRWNESFAKSQAMLAAMADEALKEFRDGKTRPFPNRCKSAYDAL
jgi:hypothetical protein